MSVALRHTDVNRQISSTSVGHPMLQRDAPTPILFGQPIDTEPAAKPAAIRSHDIIGQRREIDHARHYVRLDVEYPARLQASKTKAQFLIAIASNDDQRSPNEKNVLKETFEKAKLPAEIEVYSGAHGWCPPDSRVYNEPDAEKAWTRLLALYGKTLL
jgi:Dienelactone hydrolase family